MKMIGVVVKVVMEFYRTDKSPLYQKVYVHPYLLPVKKKEGTIRLLTLTVIKGPIWTYFGVDKDPFVDDHFVCTYNNWSLDCLYF